MFCSQFDTNLSPIPWTIMKVLTSVLRLVTFIYKSALLFHEDQVLKDKNLNDTWT